MATDWSKYKTTTTVGTSGTDWSKYKTGATTAQPEKKVDFFGGVGTFLKGLTMLPKTIAASVLQATQGKKGASVVERDWADRFISNVGSDIDRFVQETAGKYGEAKILPGMHFKITDIASLPQNMAFSLTSMGAGVGASIGTALVPLPGMRVAAWATGTAASGAAAYSATTYQIMQQYLEAKDSEKRSKIGKGLTKEEEVALKDDFDKKAHEYGLWEAVPEAISNLGFGKLLQPLTKVAGKAIAGKMITFLAGTYGTELLTETVTQKGQSAIEVEAGLREGNLTWTEAFKEIFPQTFLLTTLFAGAGATGAKAMRTYQTKVNASLEAEAKKKKVPLDSNLYQETKKQIDQGFAELQGEKPIEEQPTQIPQQPTQPIAQEVKGVTLTPKETPAAKEALSDLLKSVKNQDKYLALDMGEMSWVMEELRKKGMVREIKSPLKPEQQKKMLDMAKKANDAYAITKEITAPDAQPQMAVSKAGVDLLMTAMKEKIIQKGDMPTHERTNLIQRYDNAVQFTSQNFQQAQDIALGRAEAPAGYFKSDIYEAVEAQALLDSNVELIDQLTNSVVPTQAGQELVGFKGTDELNPIDRIKEVRAVLKEVKAESKKKELLTKVKGETKKKNLTKAELETKLSKFIEDNIC